MKNACRKREAGLVSGAMILRNLADLLPHLPPRGRLLGLDVGETTIGLAVSDPDLKLATPVDTIRRTKFAADMEALDKVVKSRGAGGLVVGFPLNMDGTQGPRAQSVRHFADAMAKRSPNLPIVLWDERMSTQAVQRFLITQADLSRAKRARSVDKMAAAYILQGALDWLTASKRDLTP
ncbi:MAG: Holliday junction resolvase [Rhodospirillales bacterium]|nr:Holliday junction resolvase [Rhodospirillales bacterium]